MNMKSWGNNMIPPVHDMVLTALQLKLEEQWNFNCWCFTALVLGLTEERTWFEEEDMEYLLKTDTIEVKELQPGDIIVYRSTYRRTLIHTCVYIGELETEVLTKNGKMSVDLTLLRCVDEVYIAPYDARIIEYRRLKS
jgi:hypothetical protein